MSEQLAEQIDDAVQQAIADSQTDLGEIIATLEDAQERVERARLYQTEEREGV